MLQDSLKVNNKTLFLHYAYKDQKCPTYIKKKLGTFSFAYLIVIKSRQVRSKGDSQLHVLFLATTLT